MDIEIKTVIKSQTYWDGKCHSVILVNDKQHINTVFKYLCNIDEDWISYKDIIQLKPEINNIGDINVLCNYSGKTCIYNVTKFISDMAEKGIDIFIYQQP